MKLYLELIEKSSTSWGGKVLLPSKAFPSEPLAMVEQAVQDALASVAAAEDVPLDDLTCVRDYSAACPTGVIL